MERPLRDQRAGDRHARSEPGKEQRGYRTIELILASLADGLVQVLRIGGLEILDVFAGRIGSVVDHYEGATVCAVLCSDAIAR
ncbi:hypothetical protein [Sphingomonas faeni]|uniref:hypothetical protein n=1 Tax=Sphingomonas faeni TaxID=185950 RepID=UPI002784D898|nr:hypothetical protein [Sphingomonas faeni]MDQ0838513.1 hypothetical protein [Sphingomonas faeni]